MTAKHRATVSRERRAALIVIIAAAVIAVACAVGPVWIARAGVLIALVGAAASLMFAYRELARIEAVHRAELKTERMARTLAAREHHAESMELISTFKTRYLAHAGQVDGLRGELATMQHELSTVRGNLVSARAESVAKAQTIAELQSSLAERERELSALQQQVAEAERYAEEAEVVTLPTRGIARKTLAAQVPTAAELWCNGDHPTSVDLDAIDVALFASGRTTAMRTPEAI